MLKDTNYNSEIKKVSDREKASELIKNTPKLTHPSAFTKVPQKI